MPKKQTKLFRYDLIHYIAQLNSAKVYLEIGIHDGTCMQRIQLPCKIGVDSNANAPGKKWCTKFYPFTSDIYFQAIKNEKFDIIFIDGLHIGTQVSKDIKNALTRLNPGGAIVLHDMNPATEWHERPGTNGDCWRAMYLLRTSNPDVIAFTIDADQGLGVILPRPDNGINFEDTPPTTLNYSILAKDRTNVIGLVDTKTGLAKIEEYYK